MARSDHRRRWWLGAALGIAIASAIGAAALHFAMGDPPVAPSPPPPPPPRPTSAETPAADAGSPFAEGARTVRADVTTIPPGARLDVEVGGFRRPIAGTTPATVEVPAGFHVHFYASKSGAGHGRATRRFEADGAVTIRLSRSRPGPIRTRPTTSAPFDPSEL